MSIRANHPTTLRAGSDTWTNMPLAGTEYLGLTTYRSRAVVNGKFMRISIGVVTAGASGANLKIQYTTDLTGAAGWADLTTAAVLTSTGPAVSTWMGCPAAAKGQDCLLRIWGVTGDGAADPVIGYVALQTKS